MKNVLMLQIISGAYCECTNFLCDHHHGKRCSGPDHGTCVCNTCVCKPGWIGEACQCENSTSNCINAGMCKKKHTHIWDHENWNVQN